MDSSQRIWHERGLRDAALAGDTAAWKLWYEQCFPPLYAYVHLRTGRDRHRTEELVQECWLIAVRRLRSFDPERGTFESWLRGIADNVLRNHRRRWLRNQPAAPARAAQAPAQGSDAVQPGPTAEERLQLAEQIALALTALPGRYQAVLRAKYHDQLSVAHIAAAWNETPKAIESLLSRARAAFRQAYTKLTEGGET